MAHKLSAKPVSQSPTTLTELTIPAYSNFGGKIHSGILLSLMHKIAFTCTSWWRRMLTANRSKYRPCALKIPAMRSALSRR